MSSVSGSSTSEVKDLGENLQQQKKKPYAHKSGDQDN